MANVGTTRPFTGSEDEVRVSDTARSSAWLKATYYTLKDDLLSLAASTTCIQDIRYSWDAAANLTQREDLITAQTESFSYDILDRLTGVSGAYSESYEYDATGNLISKGGLSYTYGSQPHAVTQVGLTGYSYDANGNMLSGNGRTITWDMENRPLSVTKDSVTTTYVYDGDGKRIKKVVDDGQTEVTTIYINQYYEKTGTEVTTHYYLGGKLIAVKQDTVLSYIHQDHLGSTSVISDTSGSATATLQYLPFGAQRALTGTLSADKLFTGQRLDDNTGLYYYNARYYDPEIGRFISADIYIQNFTNPQSLNRYSYCLNNPLKYIGPSGHDADHPARVPLWVIRNIV